MPTLAGVVYVFACSILFVIGGDHKQRRGHAWMTMPRSRTNQHPLGVDSRHLSVCVVVTERFKTEAGCDLAVARSGEALGASGSWSPDSVPVIRGRADTADDVPGVFLLVLPAGSSVAEVLSKVCP